MVSLKAKKRLLILTALALLFTLIGCKGNLSQDTLEKTTCENLFVNYDVETSKENYDFYQVGNGDSIFTETVKKNKIDKDYNEELLSATTTAEYMIIEKKYISAWYDEMLFSADAFSNYLNSNDRIQFIKSQKSWEKYILSDIEVLNDIINSNRYGVNMGSTYQFLKLSEKREILRERAIKIKYLTYLIETQTAEPVPAENCVSLYFSYTQKDK